MVGNSREYICPNFEWKSRVLATVAHILSVDGLFPSEIVRKVSKSDLSAKFLFYQMNVYIIWFTVIAIYIIKKIPKQHTLRSTVVQLFIHFMPYKIMTKFCKSCNRCQLNYPKCLRGSQPCPPPPCFIYFITLRQHYFPNLPKTDLTLVFWLTP